MSLRDQSLSFGQLETLKVEDIGIALEAKPRDGLTTINATDFVDIDVTITNHLGTWALRSSELESIPLSLSSHDLLSIPAPRFDVGRSA